MRHVLICALLFGLCLPAQAASVNESLGGLLKAVGSATQGETSQSAPSAGTSAADLSNAELSDGLKQALTEGVRFAIQQLGTADGFLGDELVRIALPDRMAKLGTLLRGMGQGKLVDDFVTSMNRAAEKAVPATADILVGAVQGMSVEDAQNVLAGANDAATRYFEGKTRSQLHTLVKPLVDEAMEATQVTQAYKLMTEKAGNLTNMLTGNQDLDEYVTTKTLDGLFVAIAEKEADIRNNPLARNTELLQKVFSAF